MAERTGVAQESALRRRTSDLGADALIGWPSYLQLRTRPRTRVRAGYSPRWAFDARLVTATEKRDGCSRTSGLSMLEMRSMSLIH
jgi:hypothetical protein